MQLKPAKWPAKPTAPAHLTNRSPVNFPLIYRANSDYPPGSQAEIISTGLEKAGLPRD